MRQKNYIRARTEFGQLLKEDPRYVRGMLGAGYLAVLTGNSAKAQKYYERALLVAEEDLSRAVSRTEKLRLGRLRETAYKALNSVK